MTEGIALFFAEIGEMDIGSMSAGELETLLERLDKMYESLLKEEPPEEEEEEHEEWEAALETLDDLIDDARDALDDR